MAEETEESKSSRLPLILIIVGVVVILVGAVVGTLFFTGVIGGSAEPQQQEEGAAEKPAEEKQAPAIYYPLKPEFTVNFQDPRAASYMQLAVQVMTREPKVVEALKTHDPLVRNNLLLLFSQQNAKELRTRQGKEQLRAAVKEELTGILEKHGVDGEVEAVYFTSFVMQ